MRSGGGRRRKAAVAEVLAVDPDDVELVRQHLDLAGEVDGGEAAVAEGARKGVGRRGQLDAGVGQLTHQPGHQHRVARIVQLEFVDAHQLVVAQRIYRLTKGQRADQVGVFDEGAESLRPGNGVPQRRQQVGLADAEAAVEVDSGP